MPARFNGPPGTGNGGYVSGLLAEAYHSFAGAEPHDAGAPVTVTLREPPPLETPLALQPDGDRLNATSGGAVIATAEPGAPLHDPVPPVAAAVAAAAEPRYAGLRGHPFPGCFACGPQRSPRDGMRLSPGPVAAPDGSPDPQARVACTWTPDPSLPTLGPTVTSPIVWAALDCPGGWASDELENRPMVLGRITAAVYARPMVGDRCVLVARVLGTEGRKTFTASSAYDPDGRVLGRAEATWIAFSL